MVELVDTQDLKSCGRLGRVGSSPTPGTFKHHHSSLSFYSIYFQDLRSCMSKIKCDVHYFHSVKETGGCMLRFEEMFLGSPLEPPRYIASTIDLPPEMNISNYSICREWTYVHTFLLSWPFSCPQQYADLFS